MSRRTRLPEPWRRIDGGAGKLGATYRHSAGYVIQHCGHPTANWPYALYGPDDVMILGINGRAWPNLEAAAGEVARLLFVKGQAALPGDVGAVRDVEIAAPALADVAFTLTAPMGAANSKQSKLF